MWVVVSLFLKSIFLDTFTLWYKDSKASYMSLVVFFPMIRGIKDPSLNPTRFFLHLLPTCCVMPYLWWICRRYNHLFHKVPKFSIYRRFCNLNFHSPKWEVTSKMWLSHIGSGHYYNSIKQLGFHTPTTLHKSSVDNSHRSMFLTKSWTYCLLKPSNIALIHILCLCIYEI